MADFKFLRPLLVSLISLRTEEQNNVLTLKGLPTTNKVKWGVSEFMVPQAEIQFKIVP